MKTYVNIFARVKGEFGQLKEVKRPDISVKLKR